MSFLQWVNNKQISRMKVVVNLFIVECFYYRGTYFFYAAYKEAYCPNKTATVVLPWVRAVSILSFMVESGSITGSDEIILAVARSAYAYLKISKLCD